MGIIGGNAPDLDLLYSYRGSPGPGQAGRQLSYLLEHRGYTHTVLGCVVLALLLYGGVEWWLRRRRVRLRGAGHVALLGVALVCTGLHLAMDALNSYGVHPFWPLDNGWVYGDSVFIVEPLYWAAAAPLIFLLESLIARVLFGLALLALVLASVVSGWVAHAAAAFLAVAIGGMLVLGWRASARTAAFASAAAFASVTAVFVLAGQIAAGRCEAAATADFPDERVIDHVLSPLPADPLCWDALVLQTRGDAYHVRHAVLALAPALIPADACGRAASGGTTLTRQTPPTVRDAASIRWREFVMSKRVLAGLVRDSCDAAALMRFARVPFAVSLTDGWLMGDLRFDRGPKPGFSDLRIHRDRAPARACPWTPPWVPPRADLLN